MDKGIAGLEMNSSIKQRRVKKSRKNCPVLSVKSLKHKYDSVSDIKSNFLHGYFKCFLIKRRTKLLEKKYE